MASSFLMLALIALAMTALGTLSRSLVTGATVGGVSLSYMALQSGNAYLMGTFALMLTFAGLATATWIMGPVLGGGSQV